MATLAVATLTMTTRILRCGGTTTAWHAARMKASTYARAATAPVRAHPEPNPNLNPSPSPNRNPNPSPSPSPNPNPNPKPSPDPYPNEALRRELYLYNPDYLARPHIVALNKLDLPLVS